MTAWEAVTWYLARAGGLTAYALLTAAVVVGLALTLHWQSPRWPRLINSEWHNYLTLLSLIFVSIHVLAVWIDPFTHFGLNEIWIPLASHYRPPAMAFGIVGLYLGIAIGLSTWLRPVIGYQLWRRLHVLTLVLYALVTLHGITAGTDSRTWWALALYLGSAGLVGLLLVFRLQGSEQHATNSQPANAPSRALTPHR
jgi:predicted ferric reductase